MATLEQKKYKLKDLKEEFAEVEKMSEKEICEAYNMDPENIQDLKDDFQHEIDELEEEIEIEEAEEEEYNNFYYNKFKYYDTI